MGRLTEAILAIGRVLDRAFGWETSPPRLSEAEVLRIARAATEEQGWPWSEDEQVSVGSSPGSRDKPGSWHVMTNANYRGGNVNIWIDDGTGAVYHKGFAPY